MILSRILSSRFFSLLISLFTCLIITACDTQDQTVPIDTPIEKNTESKITPKTAPEKTTEVKVRPALKLSIDDIPVEYQNKNETIYFKDEASAEKNSALFEKLNKASTEDNINLSGKLLTDENKLDNKEYLDSVDGLQINIEGSFD